MISDVKFRIDYIAQGYPKLQTLTGLNQSCSFIKMWICNVPFLNFAVESLRPAESYIHKTLQIEMVFLITHLI